MLIRTTAGTDEAWHFPGFKMLGLSTCWGWIALLLVLGPCACASPVTLGIDTLAARGFPGLAGKRVGLVTNPSGVSADGRRTLDILRAQPSFRLTALFGPEHGVHGTIPAGEYVPTSRDPRTGIIVHSLYGATRKPTAAMLRDIDVLIYDLQDVGSRSYTFISTLGLVMQAAAEAGIPVYVLDRPNPLGGVRVEGGGVAPDWFTFVAQYDIPYVYGLTIAELAGWINERWLARSCRLHLFKMGGWQRRMVWEDTGLKWVPTSPNIPGPNATWGYAATGLLGDIGITNGAKVTSTPFEVIAAENLDGAALAARLNGLGLSGTRFEPTEFFPRSGAFQTVRYTGVRVRVDPRTATSLLAINYHALDAIRALQPQRNFFARAGTGGIAMFDKINGGESNRSAWLKGATTPELQRGWSAKESVWRAERRPFLLYPE
jgi:uncharacterized protein YbbC (DUF1343 family)